MNAEDYMWRRAWSYMFEQYVKIINTRKDSNGVPIYDGLLAPFSESSVYMFRRGELGNIQWIPYGSKS